MDPENPYSSPSNRYESSKEHHQISVFCPWILSKSPWIHLDNIYLLSLLNPYSSPYWIILSIYPSKHDGWKSLFITIKAMFFPFFPVVFSSDRRTLEPWKSKHVAAAPSAPLSYEAGAKGVELQQMSTVKMGDFSRKSCKTGDETWKSCKKWGFQLEKPWGSCKNGGFQLEIWLKLEIWGLHARILAWIHKKTSVPNVLLKVCMDVLSVNLGFSRLLIYI